MIDHDIYFKLVNAGWELSKAADRMSDAGDDEGETIASDALAALIDLLEAHESRANA